MFVCIFTAYFTLLEPFGGLSWGVLLGLPLWLSATYTYQHVDRAWAWAIGTNSVGWFMQVQPSPCYSCPGQCLAAAVWQ